MLWLAQTVVSFYVNERQFTTQLAGLALGSDGYYLNNTDVEGQICCYHKKLLPPLIDYF